LPVGGIFWLLLGAVVCPAVFSVAVGIVALALSRQAFDIVFGVLVLCFAVLGIVGGAVAMGLLRRSERLAQMQNDFVANVSHELRTPLAGIRLLAETIALGRAEDPSRRKEVADLLLQQSERLHETIGRILTWRRLEAGAAIFQLASEQPDGLINEAIEPFATGLTGTGIEIHTHVDADLPAVRVDRDAMIDVLRNLVDNAVKFGGDKGPVEVVATTRGDTVVIEVRDQGPGIPGRERKRIFERFYRVPVHMRGKQGAGLGWAIVKAIAEAHQGWVEVESEAGIGTAFLLHLPIYQPPAAEQERASSANSQNDAEKPAETIGPTA